MQSSLDELARALAVNRGLEQQRQREGQPIRRAYLNTKRCRFGKHCRYVHREEDGTETIPAVEDWRSATESVDEEERAREERRREEWRSAQAMAWAAGTRWRELEEAEREHYAAEVHMRGVVRENMGRIRENVEWDLQNTRTEGESGRGLRTQREQDLHNQRVEEEAEDIRDLQFEAHWNRGRSAGRNLTQQLVERQTERDAAGRSTGVRWQTEEEAAEAEEEENAEQDEDEENMPREGEDAMQVVFRNMTALLDDPRPMVSQTAQRLLHGDQETRRQLGNLIREDMRMMAQGWVNGRSTRQEGVEQSASTGSQDDAPTEQREQ